MDLSSIVHRPNKEYIYPRSRDTLALQIYTAAADVDRITLLYWERYETRPEMIQRKDIPLTYRDHYRDCYRTEITNHHIAAYIRYCFEIHAGGEVRWLGRYGFDDHAPDMSGNCYEFLWPNAADGFRIPEWGSSQIYYQIFPERFCNGDDSLTPVGAADWGSLPTRENYMGGDLQGIVDRLDYLADLGVTCLYLTPIFKAGSNHKYDTIDYYEIDPQFGTKETLRQLVQEAHVRGLRIVLDGVFNHCGYYCGLFQNVVEAGATSEYKDWFYIHSYPITLEPCNYDCVGHYKWMPKINLSNEEAARYFIDVGLYWIREFGIDGWRLDVADEVSTTFLERFSAEIKRLKADAILIGETWGDADRLVSGNRLDSAMNYLFKDAVTDWIAKGEITAGEFDHRINRMYSLYPDEVNRVMYNLLDSHDTARFLYDCGNDKVRLRLAVALQMTFLGCPAIYYGDEIGISGANDPLCRKAMQWDANEQDNDLRAWYRYYISLRKSTVALQEGSFRTAYISDENQIYAYYRETELERVLVVLNVGGQDAAVQIPLPASHGVWEMISRCRAADNTTMTQQGSLTKYTGRIDGEMPAYSVTIFKNKREVNT